MISRVIEARPDDLRAFLEEAARNIALQGTPAGNLKSHRPDARESGSPQRFARRGRQSRSANLQRKRPRPAAIRRSRRKSGSCRRNCWHCACRVWTLEAGVRDSAVQHCETAMHGSVGGPSGKPRRRSSRFRVDQSSKAEALRETQERFYGAGSDVTRIEQSIAHARGIAPAPNLRSRLRSQAQVSGPHGRDPARSGSSRKLERRTCHDDTESRLRACESAARRTS